MGLLFGVNDDDLQVGIVVQYKKPYESIKEAVIIAVYSSRRIIRVKRGDFKDETLFFDEVLSIIGDVRPDAHEQYMMRDDKDYMPSTSVSKQVPTYSYKELHTSLLLRNVAHAIDHALDMKDESLFNKLVQYTE